MQTAWKCGRDGSCGVRVSRVECDDCSTTVMHSGSMPLSWLLAVPISVCMLKACSACSRHAQHAQPMHILQFALVETAGVLVE